MEFGRFYDTEAIGIELTAGRVSNDFPRPSGKSCPTESFEEEICRVRKSKQLPSTSNNLNPVPALDSGGILRTGGRAGRTSYNRYCHLKKTLLPSWESLRFI